MKRTHKKKLQRIYLLLLFICLISAIYFGVKFVHKNNKVVRVDIPVARLLTLNENYQFGIDDAGKIISLNDSPDIPSIIYSGDERIVVGGNLPKMQIRNLLDILKGLKLINYLYERTFWTIESNLIVQSKPTVVFDLKSDSSIQLASLQLILEKAKIDKDQIEIIDLRFDKPVLRYAQGK